ncbi:MAG: DMT family transporter [Candidatus Methylomirabilales bacterium]
MAWIYLVGAGLFEIGFTTFLKLSEGFTKLLPSLAFLLFSAISFWLLTVSMRTIPLGTAYAVWTGIGAFGTAIIGILFFNDPINFWRIFFLTLLVGSIVGLRLVSLA